jgi:hypothetical protein
LSLEADWCQRKKLVTDPAREVTIANCRASPFGAYRYRYSSREMDFGAGLLLRSHSRRWIATGPERLRSAKLSRAVGAQRFPVPHAKWIANIQHHQWLPPVATIKGACCSACATTLLIEIVPVLLQSISRRPRRLRRAYCSLMLPDQKTNLRLSL